MKNLILTALARKINVIRTHVTVASWLDDQVVDSAAWDIYYLSVSFAKATDEFLPGNAAAET